MIHQVLEHMDKQLSSGQEPYHPQKHIIDKIRGHIVDLENSLD